MWDLFDPTNFVTTVAAGLVLILVPVLVRYLAVPRWKQFKRARAQRKAAAAVLSPEKISELFGGIGESELIRLESSWSYEGDERRLPLGPVVTIESPDGADVWEVTLRPETKASDLALAAREKFGLERFYRLELAPSQQLLNADEPVARVVADGALIRLVHFGNSPWLGEGPRRQRGLLRLLPRSIRRRHPQ